MNGLHSKLLIDSALSKVANHDKGHYALRHCLLVVFRQCIMFVLVRVVVVVPVVDQDADAEPGSCKKLFNKVSLLSGFVSISCRYVSPLIVPIVGGDGQD